MQTSYLYDRVVNLRLIPSKGDDLTSASIKKTIWSPTQLTDVTINKDGKAVTVLKPYLQKRIGAGGITEYKYVLTDRVESATITSTLKEVSIVCPKSGMKPDITVKFNIIPGSVVYGIDIRVKNFHPNYDIRKYKSLIVELGYQSGSVKNTRTFTCDIFSSYIETPGPDGDAVFICVTTGHMQELFGNRPIVLEFNSKRITLEKLVQQVSLALHVEGSVLSDPVAVRLYMEDNIKQLEIDVEKRMSFDNGLQVINKLQSYLNEISENLDVNLTSALVNDELIVFQGNFTDEKQIGLGMDIIELERVNSASFSGPLLNVVAPYVPQLLPNSVFRMRPSYYTGGTEFLNDFAEELYRGKGATKDMYRIITMSVEFGTRSANQMKITALPLGVTVEDAELYRSQAADKIKYILNPDQIQEDTPVENKTATTVKTNAWYEVSGDSLLSAGNYYQVKPTDFGLSIISHHQYPAGEELTVTKTDLGNRKVPYPIAGSYIGYGRNYWWPLIAIATRAKILQVGQSEKSILAINLNDPNYIQQDHWLFVPTITSAADFKAKATPVRDVFKHMAKMYSDETPGSVLNKPDYAKAFANIYVYLGGTWE